MREALPPRGAFGKPLAIKPEIAEELREEAVTKLSADRVVLAEPDVRRGTWRLLVASIPNVRVVAPDELLPATVVERVGVIGP